MFDVFRRDLTNYIERQFTEPGDVVDIVKHMEYLMTDFDTNNRPVDQDAKTLADDPIAKAIQDEEVKFYLERKNILRTNINKVWGLVIGQCTNTVRTMLENHTDFRAKDKANYVLWLLKAIKTITSGLYMKCNKRSVYHDALLQFAQMQQGTNESLDGWL